MSDEKTEEPTDKKLDDAKKKGESPKSPDVNAAFGLLGITVCLSAGSSIAVPHLFKLFEIVCDRGVLVQTNHDMQALIYDIVKEGLLIVLPFLATSVMIGFIAGFAQVGVRVTFEPLTPKFDKLNPASGIKKIISVRSIIDFLKMVLKAAVLGTVAYVICKGLLPLLVGASMQTPEGVVSVAWEALMKLMGTAVVVFMIIGPGDFAIQKWLFVRDQRMSKDEVKREHKESEGDPQLKGQRKEIAKEMATEAPKSAVGGASVVVTNPTHYAVALKYVPGLTPLPVVVAKGTDQHALEIRAIAEELKVPIVANPPLARQLHQVPVNAAIPEALFEAVAAVLRWVRTMRQLSEQMVPPESGTDDEGRT
ncbi:MAG TPA: type III secretion system export apparatus subunit SctU [Albitalea sp.]|uniref:type III secretion system export apparatus subunit SctU n=1 Tax=Piscinibacter sp. TaxID=1903157 RepID=UPI002ED03BDE